MESAQPQSVASGLRRENESMDDFEHLEAELSSPVKESLGEKATAKDLKSDKDAAASVLSNPPGESLNSSDFSLLSDSKFDLPAGSAVFSMHEATNKLSDLMQGVDTLPRDFPPPSAPEKDFFSNLQSKTDPKSISQSFLATEVLSGGTAAAKDATGVLSSVEDLLGIKSSPESDIGMNANDSLEQNFPSQVGKDEQKTSFPEPTKQGEVKQFAEGGMGDTFTTGEPERAGKTAEGVPAGSSVLLKSKSDHEEEEEFNLAASQDSSPIRMSDKLEQYNIKPLHDTKSDPHIVEDDSITVEDVPFMPDEPAEEQPKPPTRSAPAFDRAQPAAPAPAPAPAPAAAPSPQPAPAPTSAPASAPVLLGPLDLFSYSWFKPERLHPKVESLVYWRNPKVSGAVLGVGLATLLALSYCSLISVVAYVSLAVLVGCGGFRMYRAVMAAVNKTGEGHPFRELLDKDLTVSSDRAASLAQQIVPHINASVSELRRLFLVDDILDSIKFGVLLWALTYLGAWFNGLTLVILAFVSAFTLPRLYENNKQQIDRNLELVRAKIAEITAKVQAFNPLAGAAAKKLAGSEEKKEN